MDHGEAEIHEKASSHPYRKTYGVFVSVEGGEDGVRID